MRVLAWRWVLVLLYGCDPVPSPSVDQAQQAQEWSAWLGYLTVIAWIVFVATEAWRWEWRHK